ncbi:hypothetical protein FUAX_44970 (plasmid) [Fulvitalea axinellae]|uniref:Uncharacterized protein n=1 Tax=Fulvitalea axinellae TaxID=1182444 RepID=A0AAU9CRR1_9BACT|nr:hypothetical protein FUAX_44910 [Fulvitalea axinellae]BDD12065.1 hypothetical protein FUAX_44970 [Fulvitalea axinellae]
MNDIPQPYYTVIGDELIVVVFGNELIDLSGYEVDGGDPFWYIMGTDAWFEKQKINEENFLVAKTYDKDFFSIPIDNNTSELLNKQKGILVLTPNFQLKAEDIKQTNDLEKLRKWIDTEIGDKNIEGTIYCFYTEEAKRKYHQE